MTSQATNLADLPLNKLRRMLAATERSGFPNGPAAQILREAIAAKRVAQREGKK
jgi:hypothetical protein